MLGEVVEAFIRNPDVVFGEVAEPLLLCPLHIALPTGSSKKRINYRTEWTLGWISRGWRSFLCEKMALLDEHLQIPF